MKLADELELDGNLGQIWKTARSHPLSKNYVPLIVAKSYIWLYHQHKLFSFDWIIPELVDKVGINEVLYEFETCQDQIIYFRVTIPWFLKMPVFDLVISITPSAIIRSSWLLHIRLGQNFSEQLENEVIQCILFWGQSTPEVELSLFI